jgi:hypothetical protein
MNTREVISAQATGQLSFFHRGTFLETCTIAVNETGRDVSRFTPGVVRNRYGRVIQLFPSQVDVIERVSNPFRLSDLRLIQNSKILGASISTQTFPTVRIVNLPTGVGKTIITTLGALEAQRLHRSSFEGAFAEFLQSYEYRSIRGTICTTLERTRTKLLPNVILVFSPKHLVGQWRDTFQQNVAAGTHVFPSGSSFNLFAAEDFNVAEIESRPDEQFVFVVHEGNFKKVIVLEDRGTREIEVVAGVAIFDEADSEYFPCRDHHIQIPVAMYTLFVTATPGNLMRALRTAKPTCTSNLVSRYFTDPTRPGGVDSSISEYNKPARNTFADLTAMQVVLPTERFNSNIVQEVSATIPDLHSYTVRTRRALARTFGTATNDLQNPREALEIVERDLEIRIYGRTIADMQEQLRENIAVLEANPNRTRAQSERLNRLSSTLRRVQEIDGFCGICLEDFSDTTALRLTSCCGFFICPTCHEHIRSCAKCRNPNVKYFDIVTESKPSKKKSEPILIPAPAPEIPTVNPVKDVAGFEAWLSDFPFFNSDQLAALNEVTSAAMRFGLTHLIFAGAGVDSWSGLGPDADSFFAYSIVRPCGHTVERQKKTAKRLDGAFRKFCAGERPSILILDSCRSDSVELTGIDAGVTDLIVQVGTESGGFAYTQLAGRAMRFGRSPTNPVRIIMS